MLLGTVLAAGVVARAALVDLTDEAQVGTLVSAIASTVVTTG